MSTTKIYNVYTWDMESDEWTPQDGMENPSQGVAISGLLAALRELRQMGYSCHRVRNSTGSYQSDPFVFVEAVK